MLPPSTILEAVMDADDRQFDHQFNLAADHLHAGRLVEASCICRQIVEDAPDDTEALYMLGVIAHQTGQPAEVVTLLQRARDIAPNEMRWYSLLGVNQMALGKSDEAKDSFRRAIALGDSLNGYNNLGILYKAQGRFDDAIAAYRQALAQAPGDAAVHYNLGEAYLAKKELETAAECFRQAMASDPEDWCAPAALARALQVLARPEEAVLSFQRAIVLKPEDADLHCDLGDALQTLGRFQAASEEYRRSLQLNPELARAWYSAGCAESSLGEYAVAAAFFRRALANCPDWPEALHNLGRSIFKLGQVEEAVDLFRQAGAKGDPGMAQAAIAVIIPGDPASDNQAIYDARRKWAQSQLPRVENTPSSADWKSPRRPLRIGYVCSFFQDRNWMKPVWGLIRHHDRAQFEVHLFSDAAADRIERGGAGHPQDRFHDISRLSNEAVSALVKREKIDLLIDLNGYSAMRRLPLFAMRSAAVIAGWFNMFATTGIASYDYLIGDDVVIPPDEEKFYCEKIVRVPGSYLTFEVAYPVPEVVQRPVPNQRAITFGCLAPQYKITEQLIAAWSRILQQVPQSSLVLKNRVLGAASAKQFVHDLFEKHGVSPQRVRLEGPSEHYQFLETYGEIDIALDTFPYNGGTTTMEALWQGVPVVAFSGDRWVSRTSASLLHAATLGELVAAGLEEYVALSVRLANSPDRLLELRRGMRMRLRNSSVCDTPGFARNMERIYLGIIQ